MAPGPNLRAPDQEYIEICKDYSGVVGPPVTFNIAGDINNDGSNNYNRTVTLANGQCLDIWERGQFPGDSLQDKVTITEVTPAGYTPSYVVTRQIGATVTTFPSVNGNSAQITIQSTQGYLVVFTNTANPDQGAAEGRFTGGGNLDLANGVSVSTGLTMHCDLKLSNNLEVNWKDLQGNSHKFHLTEHFLTIACTDSSTILQPPPAAPLDTMIGKGSGKFDNTAGYTVEFTFVDAGEGKDAIDRIALKIFQTSNPSNIVLNFPLTDIIKGNLQAHFDQPHK